MLVTTPLKYPQYFTWATAQIVESTMKLAGISSISGILAQKYNPLQRSSISLWNLGVLRCVNAVYCKDHGFHCDK